MHRPWSLLYLVVGLLTTGPLLTVTPDRCCGGQWLHRPWSLLYFVLGCVVPVGLLMNLHDGTVSNFR